MIKIQFNGEPHQLKAHALPEVLLELGAPKMCAVAINGQFVPKNEHDSVILQDADALDAFTPMQGG